MKKSRLLQVVSLTVIILTGFPALLSADGGLSVSSLKGEDLLTAVGASCRPARIPSVTEIDGVFRDYFNGSDVAAAAGTLPPSYTWGCIVPSEWWSASAADYGPAVSSDLRNMIPLSADVAANRRDLPPGAVVRPTYSSPLWSVGLGTISGIDFECYAPPVELRGRLARTYFYMAAVYHVARWTERGFMMMDASFYPGLTDYALPMLLEWHRAYPVGDSERALEELAERLQGSRNAFVDYPDLPEYLWGSLKDEPFTAGGNDSGILRGSYPLSHGRVALRSPHVPSDAVWTVDGVPVSGNEFVTTAIGPGDHLFRYTSRQTGETGRLIIKITR